MASGNHDDFGDDGPTVAMGMSFDALMEHLPSESVEEGQPTDSEFPFAQTAMGPSYDARAPQAPPAPSPAPNPHPPVDPGGLDDPLPKTVALSTADWGLGSPSISDSSPFGAPAPIPPPGPAAPPPAGAYAPPPSGAQPLEMAFETAPEKTMALDFSADPYGAPPAPPPAMSGAALNPNPYGAPGANPPMTAPAKKNNAIILFLVGAIGFFLAGSCVLGALFLFLV